MPIDRKASPCINFLWFCVLRVNRKEKKRQRRGNPFLPQEEPTLKAQSGKAIISEKRPPFVNAPEETLPVPDYEERTKVILFV